MSRASFDTFYHNFDFNFPSNAHALRYIRDFSGDPIVESQAIHELTHFYFSVSPVTRALRALRNKALFTLLSVFEYTKTKQIEKIDKDQLFRAVNQWRMAEAITQYLLPLYEGTALMAEFDCCLVPPPAKSDAMTFLALQVSQSTAAIKGGRLFQLGLHKKLGHPDGLEAVLLDAISDRLTSPEIHARKIDLLNYPLDYQMPSKCYLVAWLFVREVHLHISRAIGGNASPLFVIKYLRSYFLEDWELVSKILDLFHCRCHDTYPVICHLQHRLKTFSQLFTSTEYDAYRNGVEELHERGEQNFEFLPGLMRNIEIDQCNAISSELQKASYDRFAPTHLGDIGDQIYGALMSLQNRQGYIAIHQGNYQVEAKDNRLYLTSGSETLVMNTVKESAFRQQSCRVTFSLSCAGEVLQRIARFHTEEGMITAWIGGHESGAYTFFADATATFEHSEAAQSYIEPRLRLLRKIYRDEFVKAIDEGCVTSCTIFTEWLREQQGFYYNLLMLSERLGYEVPPRNTLFRLFDKFFSQKGLDFMVLHSLGFGIGYNMGEVSRGKARELMCREENFRHEIEASSKIRAATGIEDFYFFDQEEGEGYPFPRYYF